MAKDRRQGEREQGHYTYQVNARFSLKDIQQAIDTLDRFAKDRAYQSDCLYDNGDNHRGAYFSGMADGYSGAAEYLRGRFDVEGTNGKG